MTDIKMRKDDLLAELRGKLTTAAEYDREQLRLHKAACVESGKARAAYLRDVAKRPPAALAEMTRDNLFDSMPSGTSCPMSVVALIEREIENVSKDYRKVFTISVGTASDAFQTVRNSRASYIHIGHLIAWTPTPAASTVC